MERLNANSMQMLHKPATRMTSIQEILVVRNYIELVSWDDGWRGEATACVNHEEQVADSHKADPRE